VVKLWLASASGAAMAWGIKVVLRTTNPLIAAISILVPYGLIFFAVAFALRIPEASRTLGRLTRRSG
jgi:putative peptidoglycan lipid II flippase